MLSSALLLVLLLVGAFLLISSGRSAKPGSAGTTVRMLPPPEWGFTTLSTAVNNKLVRRTRRYGIIEFERRYQPPTGVTVYYAPGSSKASYMSRGSLVLSSGHNLPEPKN